MHLSIINKYIIKYLLIVIVLELLRIVIKFNLTELVYILTGDDGNSSSRFSMYVYYDYYIRNFFLAIVVFFDLKKLNLNKVFIPLLTITSMFAGLFFFAFLVVNKLIDSENGKR